MHEERDQRRNRPLTQVRRGVATCEGGQAAAVQILHSLHQSTSLSLPSLSAAARLETRYLTVSGLRLEDGLRETLTL